MAHFKIIQSIPGIHEVLLADENRTCIHPAKSQGFRPCKRKVHPVDKASAEILRKEILAASSSTDDISEKIESFAELCCCKQHRRSAKENGVFRSVAKRWSEELAVQVEKRLKSKDKKGEQASVAAHRVDEPSSSLPTPQLLSDESRRPLTRSHTKEDLLLPTELNQLLAPHFIPYKTTLKPRELNAKLLMPLTLLELKTGIVYLFTRVCDPGFCKIGFTTQGLVKRFGSIQLKCGYVPNVRHQLDQIPWAKRVERLIHLELMLYRRKERLCRDPSCAQQHEEWFEIGVEEASAVMDRWGQWIETAKPYDAQGNMKQDWMEICQRLAGEGKILDSSTLLEAMSILEDRNTIQETITSETVADEDLAFEQDCRESEDRRQANINNRAQEDEEEAESAIILPGSSAAEGETRHPRVPEETTTNPVPVLDPQTFKVLSNILNMLFQIQYSIVMLQGKDKGIEAVTNVQQQLVPLVQPSSTLGNSLPEEGILGVAGHAVGVDA